MAKKKRKPHSTKEDNPEVVLGQEPEIKEEIIEVEKEPTPEPEIQEETNEKDETPEEVEDPTPKPVVKGFTYGRGSRRRMEGVDDLLIQTAELALSTSTDLDWGVGLYGGLRSSDEQHSLYLKNRSTLDGFTKKSYHQTGRAIDLVPYVGGKFSWDNVQDFLTIKYLMTKAWNKLKFDGVIPSNLFLHWGGYWKSRDINVDGKMQPNERGWDLPHFEIRSFKQKQVFHADLHTK